MDAIIILIVNKIHTPHGVPGKELPMNDYDKKTRGIMLAALIISIISAAMGIAAVVLRLR